MLELGKANSKTLEILILIWTQGLSDQGASASDWAAVVSGAVGGKAGGKGPTSIGNGTNTDKVEEAISLAADYLNKFKL
jgi:alanyl-tRNA synthetase